MRLLIIFFLLFNFSCTHKAFPTRKAIIIKQWHASAGVSTQDIEASKKMPQYQNQKEIYDYLVKSLDTNKKSLLIAEGCESGKEVDQNFAPSFNGWNMPSLTKIKSQDNYSDIVTSLPLKFKAKYTENVRVLCADNEALMKKNQLALSDARGFLGFYMRLKQSSSDRNKFASYKKALEETQGKEIADPIHYTKTQTINSLNLFNHYVQQRNLSFVEIIKKNIHNNPILIVGGLHVKDLIKQLRAEGIETEVMTPKGYPVASETLGDDLLNELEGH